MTNQKSLSISHVNVGYATGGKFSLISLLMELTPATLLQTGRPDREGERGFVWWRKDRRCSTLNLHGFRVYSANFIGCNKLPEWTSMLPLWKEGKKKKRKKISSFCVGDKLSKWGKLCFLQKLMMLKLASIHSFRCGSGVKRYSTGFGNYE